MYSLFISSRRTLNIFYSINNENCRVIQIISAFHEMTQKFFIVKIATSGYVFLIFVRT